MDRLKIWLIPGLIVILALAGLVYFRGRLPKLEPTTPVTQEEERTLPKGFAKPVEPSPQEKAETDADAMTAALHSGAISDCEKITWSVELKNQCEDNLNYAAALKSGDESQCNLLYSEALKLQCLDKIYMTAAVDEKDLALCEKISDAALKKMCLEQVQVLLSRYADSAENCSSIASAQLRQQCEDNFYLQDSKKNLNLEGCDNISDSNLSDQCRETVTNNIEVIEQSKQAAQSATATKTLQEILALCNSLTGARATTCKDSVYPQLAFDEKDLSYCDLISDDLKARECTKEQGDKLNTYYLRQSLAANDKTLCNQISDAELKALCESS
jgi:hypothetical protein